MDLLFLLLLMANVTLHHYGRSLGIGAIIATRLKEPRTRLRRTVFSEAT
jgi:hypothetical protein